MSSFATPPIPPHFHEQQRLSPTRSSMPPTPTNYRFSNNAAVSNQPSNLNPRKRKASPASEDDEMTLSTSPQPPTHRDIKRSRPNLTGRPLTVDRLLETLDKDQLSTVLRTLSERNPQLRDEILHIAPRPSVHSTLEVLQHYLQKLRASFPLGPNPRSDYSYDRVRPQWNDLLNALTDFTPHFLPPNESQSSNSLAYLDGVTEIIHQLPEWDSAQYNLAKQEAYESISKAWANVIKEASKRGGGIQLQYGGWEEKMRTHNQKAGGLMQEAWEELGQALGWLKTGPNVLDHGVSQARQDVRNQLFGGTYGEGPGQGQILGVNMRTGNGGW